MARSYRKRPFFTYHGTNMKPWRMMVNRKHRHNCKQLINNCADFDSLILPTIDESGNLYDSPRDGKMRWMEKPLLNDCEWGEFDWRMRFGHGQITFRGRDVFAETGHHGRYCNCYDNKRGWYWKVLRK